MTSAPTLIPLLECAGVPADRVGRKAVMLGWATAEGISTPGGFVLPAECFWAALQACRVAEQARYLAHNALRLDPRQTHAVAAAIRVALASNSLEKEAASIAEQVFPRLGSSRVVARSSAAMEDGATAAFPGIFVSIIDIRSPEALALAIASCWRSAFSVRAIDYLLRVRAEPVDFSLAILLQPFVDTAWYGLYVSIDPVGGAQEPRVDLSSAGPDALVGGAAATLTATFTRGRWTGSPEIAALAGALEGVHRAADLFVVKVGTAVDIEFALPARGEVVILQCRPITGLRTSADIGRGKALRGALHGRGCSGGKVTGTVVDMIAEPLNDGVPRIAVLDALAPDSYRIVFAVDGLVTEADASPLGHIAILCRELGIPFVSGVAGARARFSGRSATLDGRLGTLAPASDLRRAAKPAPPIERAEVAISSLELIMRVLAEIPMGGTFAVEAERTAMRYARALGARHWHVLPANLALSELAALEPLGRALFGDSFSVGAAFAEFTDHQRRSQVRR